MCDPHGVQRAFQFALPMLQECLEAGKEGRQVVFLPDKKLQQLGVVGDAVMNLRSCETITVQANQKFLANQCGTSTKAPFHRSNAKVGRLSPAKEFFGARN